MSVALAVGCSAAPPAAPEPDAVNTRDDAFSCGDYPAKQCDPQRVVDYIWTDVDDAVAAVGDCGSCAGVLVASGAVIATGTGGPIVASVSLLWDAVMFVSDCQQCVEYG